MAKDLALRFVHSFATHDCARVESLKKCCTAWEETLICWLKFHLITFYVEKIEANQSSYYSYENNQHQRNTPSNLFATSPCHLEWCWHCLFPGCRTWVYELQLEEAGGWLAWIEEGTRNPQKKTNCLFGCFSSSQSERSNHPKHTQMLMEEKTYQWFSYHNHYLYTLHKQSSRTHAPKIYRAWSDTLSWNQLQSLPHKKSCEARNVDLYSHL